MSVRPVTSNGIETTSAQEAKASKQQFAAYVKSLDYSNISSREIAEGVPVSHTAELIQAKIKFAKLELEEDKILTKMIEKRVRKNSANAEPIKVSSFVVQLIKNKKKKEQKESLSLN